MFMLFLFVFSLREEKVMKETLVQMEDLAQL